MYVILQEFSVFMPLAIPSKIKALFLSMPLAIPSEI